MSLRTEIETKLGRYFEEMNCCERAVCYWAMLHLAVVLPDICAALEAADGKAKRERYQDWCTRYLADERLTGLEWYGIRCTVLPQGRTLAWPGVRYGSYRFHYPGGPHKIPYPPNNPEQWPDGKDHLPLDVAVMAKEVTAAVRKWIADLERDHPEAQRPKNVRKYLRTVAVMDRPIGFNGAAGFTSAPAGPAVSVAEPPKT